jgi:hypothetical protein
MEDKMTIRHVLATLSILAASGVSCRDITTPLTGTLYFQIDGATCKGTHSTYFEIDTTEVGPETLAPAQTSKGYVVTEGIHATRARLVDYYGSPADLWTLNRRLTVPANGTATTTVVC